MRTRRFELDRAEGKLLGVCAGLANHTGIDVTIIRVGLVLITLMGAFPWTVVAYGAAALIGHRRRRADTDPVRFAGREETRERMRNLDLRMRAVETCATSANSRLAREIEDLR
ncbi:PspC domain-containing protein [Sphingosinicella sp. CPCC 101087]|uniref:PspC domain-containing protein n=1 Tax=Sphingosinicella sp. CPCC 101087 TaxID=2497754 RepID=UPI00101B5D89|nr:PspC domain-containing protein [Sphingosinicella sp. CPCC 101087]